MDSISKRRLIVLIGNPVSHSFSPAIHNIALDKNGLDCEYKAITVTPDELPSVIEQLHSGAFAGANVTIPHKEAVMALLDVLTPIARTLGAVNTIRVVIPDSDESDRILLEGDNTDVTGFCAPLEAFRDRIIHAPCTVWGAGGAARAVVFSLLNRFDCGIISIVTRSLERGHRLAESLDPGGTRIRVHPWASNEKAIRGSRVLINATPLGMTPDINSTPCVNSRLLAPNHLVYDLVYNPLRTRLLADAEEAGAITIGGLEMLIGQASQSFRVWTGTEMPVDIVRDGLIHLLAERI
jgi:shikimate dehydrogenase